MAAPLNPPPVRGGGSHELPAYISNGLIGLRVRDVPLLAGMSMISGLSGEDPERQIEAKAPSPYPVAADVCISGVWLCETLHAVSPIEQRYDFSAAELSTQLRFEAKGIKAQIDVLTFCSRTAPSLVLQEISVAVDGPCELIMRAMIDTRGVPGHWLRRRADTPGEEEAATDGILWWGTIGKISSCGISYTTEMLGAPSAERTQVKWAEQVPPATNYSFRAHAGRRYRMRQIASLVPSVLHEQPDMEAARLAAFGKSLGFDALRKYNRAAWIDLWKGRIRLVGADKRWQALSDAAFFYLNTSAHSSSPSSTSIFGLASWHDYHYYFGHVMWDIEAFVIPPLLLLQPAAAKAMLEYRFRCLEAAFNNAKLWGRTGLQFPWESSPSIGQEAAPQPGTGAWHEDHVTLGVARAFAQYAYGTGDWFFLKEKAWPVLYGVSQWIVCRVVKSRRGYEITESMGIAERKDPSDNAAYMNMSAKLVLRQAMTMAAELGHAVPASWIEIERKLVIPGDADGAVLSHDKYRVNEEKGSTPEPLAGLFPLGFQLPKHQEAATIDFFLPRWGQYIGSPMLSALYGVWAAWRGNRKQSLQLFEEGYAKFMTGRFLQTMEYRPDKFPEQPKAGPFFANLGGFLMALIYGLPGIQVTGRDFHEWPQRPVVLPDGWKAIEIDRVWIQGQPRRIRAAHGARRAEISDP